MRMVRVVAAIFVLSLSAMPRLAAQPTAPTATVAVKRAGVPLGHDLMPSPATC